MCSSPKSSDRVTANSPYIKGVFAELSVAGQQCFTATANAADEKRQTILESVRYLVALAIGGMSSGAMIALMPRLAIANANILFNLGSKYSN